MSRASVSTQTRPSTSTPRSAKDERTHVEVAPNRRLGFGGWFALVWLGLVLFGAVFTSLIPGIHDVQQGVPPIRRARSR